MSKSCLDDHVWWSSAQELRLMDSHVLRSLRDAVSGGLDSSIYPILYRVDSPAAAALPFLIGPPIPLHLFLPK